MNRPTNSLLDFQRELAGTAASLSLRARPGGKARRGCRAYDDGSAITLTYDGHYFRHTPAVAPVSPPWRPPRASSSLGGALISARKPDDEPEQTESEEVSREEFEDRFELDREESVAAPAAAAPSRAADTAQFADRLFARAQEMEQERVQEAPAEPPPSSSHRIFDDIASRMAHATTYDVGQVSVDRLFRDLDARLEARPAAAALKRETRSREFDLEEDLEVISAASARTAARLPEVIDVAASEPPVQENKEEPCPASSS